MHEDENKEGVDSKSTAVKNPVSPYMMFVKSWKGKHPSEKFNMSALGQIWKTMSLSEKQAYEAEYRSMKQQYPSYD